MEQDQAFVEFVVKALVDNPDAVTTERTVDEMGVLITLKVDSSDLGQVIGRQGQTAKSIRTLLRVVGAKNQARVNLKIYEPDKMNGEHRSHNSASQSDNAGQAAPESKPAPVEEEVDISAVDLNL